MKSDNKLNSFTGRSEGDLECIWDYDQSIRKTIMFCQDGDWPRHDEAEGNATARSSTDIDYTARRHDAWIEQRSTSLDDDNLIDDNWYLNEHREPEDPDKFNYTAGGMVVYDED